MISISPDTSGTTLYEQDFYLWLLSTAQVLRERKFNQVDLENLVEEILSMGRNEKRALESNLIVVLLHLLKYKYQPQKLTNSWLSSIFEHRRRLRKVLLDSPSLNNYFVEVYPECYQDARKQASIETGLPLEVFPVSSPFTAVEVMNPDYLPDE